MSVHTTVYDVFLSYSLTEKPVAELVERALREAGLDVFDPARIGSGERIRDTLWWALAESTTFVVVIPREGVPASNTAVELGAAMAWHKPIFVVYSGNGNVKIPSYLSEYRAYPVSRIDDVAQSIRHSLRTLSDKELAVLREVYSELGIPADRLLLDPASLEELARTFNLRSSATFPGERLVQELLRLRKAGQLPRLSKA